MKSHVVYAGSTSLSQKSSLASTTTASSASSNYPSVQVLANHYLALNVAVKLLSLRMVCMTSKQLSLSTL